MAAIIPNHLFIFDSDYKLHYVDDTNDTNNFKHVKQFKLDEGCLNALKSNHRKSYRDLANKYNNNETIFDIEPYNKDYIVLYNSLVNDKGVIIVDNKMFLNGGCLCRNSCNNLFYKNIKQEDDVISISALWSEGIWHFPFEALVALMSIPKDILNKCKIHVSKISNFIIEWFNILNIPHAKLVTGNIKANTLYLPRMGKCGNPYYDQIKWLQNIVNKNISDMPIEYIILIKRTIRRKLTNNDELETLLTNYCSKLNLKLYIHDDTNLPTLTEQQQIFNKAKIVFAPHGAGGINIISMKCDAWYIEFLSVEDINLCYSRLAYLCNVNYIGLSMMNNTIDTTKIINVFNEITLNRAN